MQKDVKKSVKRRLIQAAALAAVFAAIAGRVKHNATVHNEAIGRYGRYTLAEILRRSAALCTAISPRNGPLDLAALKIDECKAGARVDRLWIVDGVDGADRFQVHLVWDADTGELVTASHSTPNPHTTAQLMRLIDAVRITGSWLTTLGISAGISEQDARWRANPRAIQSGSMWSITWRSDEHKTRMIIDARTGDLRIAQCTRTRDFGPGILD